MQLYTIYRIWYSNVVPSVNVLPPEKNEDTYRRMFDALKLLKPNLNSITIVYIDSREDHSHHCPPVYLTLLSLIIIIITRAQVLIVKLSFMRLSAIALLRFRVSFTEYETS